MTLLVRTNRSFRFLTIGCAFGPSSAGNIYGEGEKSGGEDVSSCTDDGAAKAALCHRSGSYQSKQAHEIKYMFAQTLS